MTAQSRKSSPEAKHLDSPSNVREELCRRAYQLYEQRGREDGHDLEDWLQSESEVVTKRRAPVQRNTVA